MGFFFGKNCKNHTIYNWIGNPIFYFAIDPLQFQEEIKHLHEHTKSSSILPHIQGVYLKRNIETLSFYPDYECKQKVVQMTADDVIGQEKFL